MATNKQILLVGGKQYEMVPDESGATKVVERVVPVGPLPKPSV